MKGKALVYFQGKELAVGMFVECGPGKVLSGLIKRIDKQVSLHNICDLPSLEAVSTVIS